MNFSYWEQKSLIADCEFVIAGAGITGLCAALELRKLHPKARILVLERGKLPSGGSTKNAGFACFGSLSEMLDDVKTLGEDGVLKLVEMRWKGLNNLRSLLGDNALGYEPCGNFELFRPQDEGLKELCFNAMHQWNEKLRDIVGPEVSGIKSTEGRGQISNKVASALHGVLQNFNKTENPKNNPFTGALFNKYEGKLQSGAMMKALLDKSRSENIEVWFGFEIQEYEEKSDGVELLLEEGILKCSQFLIATNAFAKQLVPELEMRPARNQVLLTSPIPNNPWNAAYHIDRGYFYFRELDGRILVGGGRHIAGATEYTDQFGTTDEVRKILTDLLDQYVLPGIPYKIEMAWSGILGLGPDRSVIVKRISERVTCAVRMGGMGVAIGSVMGRDLARI